MDLRMTILADEGDYFDLGGLGVHWKIEGIRSEKRFAVAITPLHPTLWRPPFTFTITKTRTPSFYREHLAPSWEKTR